MTTKHADFWRFSLAVYRQDSVQQECLNLQDRYDIDVNLILLCAFAGAAHGALLKAKGVKEASDAVGIWQRQIVSGLRGVRRTLKPFLSASSTLDTPVAHLRTQVKALELEAERIEQQILERWLITQIHFLQRSRPLHAVEDNLRTLFALYVREQGPPALPQQLISMALMVAGNSRGDD